MWAQGEHTDSTQKTMPGSKIRTWLKCPYFGILFLLFFTWGDVFFIKTFHWVLQIVKLNNGCCCFIFYFLMKITFCLHLIVVQWRFTGVERGWKDIQQRAIGHIQTRASLLQPCGCLLTDWAKLAHWLLFVMMSCEESAVLERFEMFIIWPFLMMNMSSWDFS